MAAAFSHDPAPSRTGAHSANRRYLIGFPGRPAQSRHISGGENVYPAEVKDVLYHLEAIAEAAVIGIPDERWGETGLAIVALKADGALIEIDKVHKATLRGRCADVSPLHQQS